MLRLSGLLEKVQSDHNTIIFVSFKEAFTWVIGIHWVQGSEKF